ncbi:hypothetical protein [Phytohabitans suffuscus]|uniref:Uncharacterized protein n=1 Tax=Phytohabitans suffuscus TaxID=624315 RepID=A0A6F8YTA3_9ACTN|nr:hypothetical protein [Phytohabitans suffuscus]BCB89342.1 hypothetical protein Psuf_066550 [Phytohabitans suffuscus]
MRKRLLSGVVAAVMATTVGGAGIAEPARADGGTVPCEFIGRCPPPGPTVIFASAAMSLYWALARNVAEAIIQALVGEAARLVIGARDEVVLRQEQSEARVSVAEANRMASDYANYPVLRQDWNLFRFAGDVYQSASRDYEFMDDDFTNRAAADQIGYALNVKYPIAITAAEDSGLDQATLNSWNQEYIRANELILQKLAPACASRVTDPTTAIVEITYTCTAANGDTAVAVERYVNGRLDTPAVDLNQLKAESAIHSSWLTAVHMLPILRNP